MGRKNVKVSKQTSVVTSVILVGSWKLSKANSCLRTTDALPVNSTSNNAGFILKMELSRLAARAIHVLAAV